MRRLIPRRGRGKGFSELSFPLQREARARLEGMITGYCLKHHIEPKDLPQNMRALLMFWAKFYTLHPEKASSEHGRWLRSRKLAKWGRMGGLRTQQRYREEGRVGRLHPAVLAAKVSLSKRKFRKQKARQQESVRQGAPPEPRVAFQDLSGI